MDEKENWISLAIAFRVKEMFDLDQTEMKEIFRKEQETRLKANSSKQGANNALFQSLKEKCKPSDDQMIVPAESLSEVVQAWAFIISHSTVLHSIKPSFTEFQKSICKEESYELYESMIMSLLQVIVHENYYPPRAFLNSLTWPMFAKEVLLLCAEKEEEELEYIEDADVKFPSFWGEFTKPSGQSSAKKATGVKTPQVNNTGQLKTRYLAILYKIRANTTLLWSIDYRPLLSAKLSGFMDLSSLEEAVYAGLFKSPAAFQKSFVSCLQQISTVLKDHSPYLSECQQAETMFQTLFDDWILKNKLIEMGPWTVWSKHRVDSVSMCGTCQDVKESEKLVHCCVCDIPHHTGCLTSRSSLTCDVCSSMSTHERVSNGSAMNKIEEKIDEEGSLQKLAKLVELCEPIQLPFKSKLRLLSLLCQEASYSVMCRQEDEHQRNLERELQQSFIQSKPYWIEKTCQMLSAVQVPQKIKPPNVIDLLSTKIDSTKALESLPTYLKRAREHASLNWKELQLQKKIRFNFSKLWPFFDSLDPSLLPKFSADEAAVARSIDVPPPLNLTRFIPFNWIPHESSYIHPAFFESEIQFKGRVATSDKLHPCFLGLNPNKRKVNKFSSCEFCGFNFFQIEKHSNCKRGDRDVVQVAEQLWNFEYEAIIKLPRTMPIYSDEKKRYYAFPGFSTLFSEDLATGALKFEKKCLSYFPNEIKWYWWRPSESINEPIMTTLSIPMKLRGSTILNAVKIEQSCSNCTDIVPKDQMHCNTCHLNFQKDTHKCQQEALRTTTSSRKNFNVLKRLLLEFESSLPLCAVRYKLDNLLGEIPIENKQKVQVLSGGWETERRTAWIQRVKVAVAPKQLWTLLNILEATIDPRWLFSIKLKQESHEISIARLALRLCELDQNLKFEFVN